jgi:hypothetical protein
MDVRDLMEKAAERNVTEKANLKALDEASHLAVIQGVSALGITKPSPRNGNGRNSPAENGLKANGDFREQSPPSVLDSL